MKFRISAALLFVCMLSYGVYRSFAAAPIVNGQFPTLTPIKGTPALGTPKNPSSFTFVAGGDNRPPSDKDDQPPIFQEIVKQLSGTGAAFVIWSGDSVYGKLKDPEKDKDKEKIKKEYETFASLIGQANLPIFNVPGNHEMLMKGNVPDPTGTLVKYFEKYVGPEYGYFTYGNSAFIGLNTDDVVEGVDAKPSADTYAGNVSADQLAGLSSTLATLSADSSIAHIFVFMHRPIYATPGKSDNALGRPSGPAVQALLENYAKFPSLSFVIAGHQHLFYAYSKTSPYGTSFTRTDPASAPPIFLIAGGAGACLAGSAKPDTGGFNNYLVVNVNGAQVTVTVRNLGSTKQPGC
jgi:Calcineurin-like phosphoesterase